MRRCGVVTLVLAELAQHPGARRVRLGELDELGAILELPLRHARKANEVREVLGLVPKERHAEFLAVETWVSRDHRVQRAGSGPPTGAAPAAGRIVSPSE